MSEPIKYNKLIILVSILIPVVVAILFTVKLPNVEPLSFLPPIYASINALTALLLISALVAIKNKKIKLHSLLMKFAIALSLVFLLMYVAYHMTSESTPFGGEGTIRYIYFIILISHILLAIFVEKIEFNAPKKLSNPMVPYSALSNSVFLSSTFSGL